MKKERLVYAFIIFFGIMLLWDTCETKKILEKNYSNQQDTIQSFKRKSLADGSAIYSQDLTIISLENENAFYKDALEKAKELGIREPEMIIGTRFIIKQTGQMEPEEVEQFDSLPYLPLPYYKSRTDKWRSISIGIDTSGVLTDTTSTLAEFTYAIGDTLKSGLFNKLFRRTDKVISMKIDNPYVEVKGMNNIIIEDRKRWYQTTVAKIGFGALVGAIGYSVLSNGK
jgi:hypothetical protein